MTNGCQIALNIKNVFIYRHEQLCKQQQTLNDLFTITIQMIKNIQIFVYTIYMKNQWEEHCVK